MIICDYNYVFDPSVYLKRYFEDKGNYVFLIDEAHNLVDRAREMYSSDLYESEIVLLNSLLKHGSPSLNKSFQALLKTLKRLSEESGRKLCSQKEPMNDIYLLVNRVIEEVDAYLQLQEEIERKDDVMEIYFALIDFRRVYEFYDENFITWYQEEEDGCHVRMYCMNPANQIQERISHGIATVYFSATLSPSLYYAALLGEQEKARRLSLPSIFHQDQLALLIHSGISTRYQHRQASLVPIVNALSQYSSKSRQLHYLFPQLSLYGGVCRCLKNIIHPSRFIFRKV